MECNHLTAMARIRLSDIAPPTVLISKSSSPVDHVDSLTSTRSQHKENHMLINLGCLNCLRPEHSNRPFYSFSFSDEREHAGSGRFLFSLLHSTWLSGICPVHSRLHLSANKKNQPFCRMTFFLQVGQKSPVFYVSL